MYYRGSHWDKKTKKAAHREVTCYAESKDGIHWEKPNLGLVDWEGSKDNNIILDRLGTHCFVAFRDDNPNCPPEARYKGIARGRPTGKKGLYVFFLARRHSLETDQERAGDHGGRVRFAEPRVLGSREAGFMWIITAPSRTACDRS